MKSLSEEKKKLIWRYQISYYHLRREQYKKYFVDLPPEWQDEFVEAFSEHWYVGRCYFPGYGNLNKYNCEVPPNFRYKMSKTVRMYTQHYYHAVLYEDIEEFGYEFRDIKTAKHYRLKMAETLRPADFTKFWTEDNMILIRYKS